MAAALGLPGAALAVERITSPFLLEYSADSYSIDQGEIATFTNQDPFLSHGLASDLSLSGEPVFSAPVIARGQTRLVRGSPFLTRAGNPYSFRDPAHPTMTATLVVTALGTPLPPDGVLPSALLKIRSGRLARVAGTRKLRLGITPSEPVDVVVKARARKARLGRAERTYVTAGRQGIGMKLTAGLPRKGPVRVRVAARLTDVAGNTATVRASRTLSGGRGKP